MGVLEPGTHRKVNVTTILTASERGRGGGACLLQKRCPELAHAKYFLGQGVQHFLRDRGVRLDQLVQLYRFLKCQSQGGECYKTFVCVENRVTFYPKCGGLIPSNTLTETRGSRGARGGGYRQFVQGQRRQRTPAGGM